MAWQGIMSGAADCAVPNPLSGLVKHAERDRTETFARPGPAGESSSSSAFRATPQPHQSNHQDFFDPVHGNAMPMGMEVGNINAPSSTFGQFPVPPPHQYVDGVARDMEALRLDQAWRQKSMHQSASSPNTAAMAENSWTQSYLNSTASSSSTPIQAEMPQKMAYAPRMMMHNNISAYRMGYGGYGGAMVTQNMIQQDKGKGRIIELGDKEWEEQFANIDKLSTASAVAKEGADQAQTDITKEETANTTTNEALQKEEAIEEDDLRGLKEAWKTLQQEREKQDAMEDELAQWEAQYGVSMADLDREDHAVVDENFDLDAMLTNPTPFKFTVPEENPYFDLEGDPFERGQELLRNGALLSEAALAFEEACRRDPGRGEAWRALGDTCAANEQESKATRALERALACRGEGGQGTWMSLAVCYVNEGFESRALMTLEKWLSRTYPHVMENRRAVNVSNPWDEHQRTIESFLQAARAGPVERTKREEEQQQKEDFQASSTVDPDVQVGLGILFYAQSDYDRARDCFEAALSVRPNDFLLWNRLGATLANGGSPEEAIDAYRKALEIRPTFTRAIYNLGVSCLNVHCYHEAIEHLLTVLSMHQTKNANDGKGKAKEDNRVPGWDEMLDPYSDQDPSLSIWNTLRRGFLCMERGDLAALCVPGTDLGIFKKEGFDF